MVAQRLVSIALGALLASSCFFPVHPLGSVTFAWSIGNAVGPTACADRSASTVRIVVIRDDNKVVADDQAPCDSFRWRYLLDPGWYDASLTLLDAGRSPVSETQRTFGFYVSPRVDTFVPVAFDPAPTPR